MWGGRERSNSLLSILTISTWETNTHGYPDFPKEGGTPGTATDPAVFESQALQACHFPISRATAFSNCLPREEKAKFGEFT